MRGSHRSSSGFTLVELVLVIVLLGILSIGTVQFIGDSTTGFSNTVARAQLASEAQAVLGRVSREVRAALPRSARVTGSGRCLEFLPIAGATSYLSAPVDSAGTTLSVVPIDPPLPSGTFRTSIFPGSDPYAATSPGTLSSTVTSVAAPDGNNRVSVTLSASHQFPVHAPTQRLFFVGAPVSFCIDGNLLWRYHSYSLSSVQPDTTTLPTALNQRALLAEDIDATNSRFAIDNATSGRNAVVSLSIALERRGTELQLEHLVKVRNAP